MKLNMRINKIKSINTLEINLPIEKGLYAITGENGSGKSTVVTCASSVFFNMKMNDYFGATDPDSSIHFELNGATRTWKKQNNKWLSEKTGNMSIKGFYEGSIIFGNRFKNTNYSALRNLDRINNELLKPADDFIRTNLGEILHNNKDFYTELVKVNNADTAEDIKFTGDIFYYVKDGRRVSQFHMSTGENLLISVLNSINIRNHDRASLSKPCIMFLDEIELALHPSSLKRLVVFLERISKQYNYAIYFSTHSIELVGSITPENIFFLQRHSDNSMEIINPCYPAYATRILYDHSGYDNVILVEDDLAKEIINRLLRKHSLLSSRLVHVLPCGGYTNVIELAREVVSSNLVGKIASVSIILDGDVQEKSQKYISDHGIKINFPLNYLPIESLEKYLKSKLHDNVDHTLFRTLNDYIFHQVSLNELIRKYKTTFNPQKDTSGKKLYDLIDEELRARGKCRKDIIEIVIEHLIKHHEKSIEKIVTHLTKILSPA